MGRSTIELRCPGTKTNGTVIVSTAWQAKYGLGNPKNIGSCVLFIHPLNEDGEIIAENPHANHCQLFPGQSLPWYFPPPGTAQLVAFCAKVCDGGRAILEYDTPDS